MVSIFENRSQLEIKFINKVNYKVWVIFFNPYQGAIINQYDQYS